MTWSYSPSAALRRLPLVLAGISLAFPGHSHAAAPSLSLPVDCDMATTCSIQKYFDRAPDRERLDHRCGRLTTDGHDGTDIRLRRLPEMLRNVPVIAAAQGIVLRVRDGMADISIRVADGAEIGDRLAGNSVVIDHGNGWVTQYSHLKKGSVSVSPGDRVEAGGRVGAIGMSGNAEFAHLHFEVRKDDRPVDPFLPGLTTGCAQQISSLWSAAAQRVLAYRDADVLDSGFADTPEMARSMRDQLSRQEEFSDPAALILWGVVTGASEGDEQHFVISVPDGGPVFDRRIRVEKGGLDWIGFAGMRRPATGWGGKLYVGRYSLIKNGKIVGESNAVIKLK